LNINHPITKFLEDAKLFDTKIDQERLISHLISEKLLELKPGTFNMHDLVMDINTTYPIISGSSSSYGTNKICNRNHILPYIELVDFYNRHNLKIDTQKQTITE
jgi:hypothetical protein